MNAMQSKPATRRAGLRGSNGYSLIEMTVALAMAVIISMGIYAILSAQRRSSQSQKTYNDLQTSCTFAMDTIKNDLLLAGYNVRSGATTQPIRAAGDRSIQFEFFDQNAGDDESVYSLGTYTADTRVTLSWSGTPGDPVTKMIERWRDADDDYAGPATTVTLADNIQNFSFMYMKGNNEDWAPIGSPPTNLNEIRAIRVGLVCQAEKSNAIFNAPQLGTAPKFQRIALTAEVRPRNVNIARNPEDKTSPAVPASKVGDFIKVWDEGTCGCLDLSWTSNTDSDIAGYAVFYGLSSGNYIGRARADHTPGATQSFKLPNLPSANAEYYFAISAYDNSGNQSGLSFEVHGNPTTSIRSIGGTGAGNDTTINPLAPDPPSGLTIATPADQQINISWTKTYTDCMTVKTFGYRLYRSTNPSFVPSGTSRGLGNCIADESTLGPDAVSYLDRGLDTAQGHLVGCVPYYYKLAVVNCDPAQLSEYTDPSGQPTEYTAAQFAPISGTPTDGTQTSAPRITSKSGFRRIILSVVNPSRDESGYPDFVATKIYFSTTAYPTLTSTRDAQGFYEVSGGDLIPDGGGEIASGGGPWTINFDDEDSEIPNGSPAGIGNPQLDPTRQYFFLAVAYDICKNAATDTLQSQTSALQCADGLPTEAWRDAPPSPENVRVTRGCDGRPLTIEWDYRSSNYTDYPDFQGFRVVRCTGTGCVPSNDPSGGSGTVIGNTTYLSPDTMVEDDTVDDGLLYTYRVFAGDCYYQRWLEGLLIPAEKADNLPDNNASYANLTDLSLGYLDRAKVIGDAVTTLVGFHPATQTTIDVADTTGFTRRTFQIGTEVVECSGATATSFTGCVRGSEATVATWHFAGDLVTSYPSAPPRDAVTGDLSLNPATFQHNIVRVGADNTSAGALIFRAIEPIAWQNVTAWFKKLLYGGSPSAVTQRTLYDDATVASGSNVLLSNETVDAKVVNVPLSFTFLRQDGSLDNLVSMKNDQLALTWRYQNAATQLECVREWIPPNPNGVFVPEGPTVYGTAQNKPAAGTLGWPVPGGTNNPLDAVVAPAGSRTRVSTYVHNNAVYGTSIASVRLYYYVDSPTSAEAPPVASAYPACTPYTMVEMSNVSGTTFWYGEIPPAAGSPSTLDNKRIWYFIVAVDSEGNFDRDPEVEAGAFQYYQQPPDPCLDTPASPVLAGTPNDTSVTLDWSGSWTGTPTATYKNTNGSDIADLAGFKIYRQIGTGNQTVLATTPDPLPPSTTMYTDVLPKGETLLFWPISAGSTGTVVNVDSTDGFIVPGYLQVDFEVFYCAAKSDQWHFTSCTRAQKGSVAADHAEDALVTQDLRALENVSYTVRAVDRCTSAPNFSGDSNSFTAFPPGGCSPVCSMQVSTSSILPGGSFTVSVTACAKAGNGSLDTIYVQGCSDCDVDVIPLTEQSGDAGVFTGTVGTLVSASCTGGGGDSVLTVRDGVAGQVRIGGWADTSAGFSGSTCQGSGFSCGSQKTVEVAPPAPDPCVGITTPSAPSITSVTPDSCVANSNWGITTTWTGPTPTATLFYRVYMCSNNDNGTGDPDCVLAKVSPTGVEPPATVQTSSSFTYPDTSGAKANSKEYWFQVEAVSTKTGCTDPSRWMTEISPKRVDSCP